MSITIAAIILIALIFAGVFFLFKQIVVHFDKVNERLADIVTEHQEFIAKHINEKVVYLNQGEPYVPTSQVEKEDPVEYESEEVEIGAEILGEIKNNQVDKK